MNCPHCKHELTPSDLKRICKNAVSQEHGAAGGQARAKQLSSKRRSEIARKAAKSRWDKKNKETI